jgi:protease-4
VKAAGERGTGALFAGNKRACPPSSPPAAEDPKVLAIVLRIDSPGGSAVASDLIWREVVQIKKPVIASMGDVAASGGYYVAMGARKIFAEPGTVTGSIGVVGGKLVLGGLYKKIGITTAVISRGKNSGALSDTQPFTPEERKAWTTLLEDTYRQFVDKAAQGRKMPKEKLEELAQGRVYTGRMAVANGLVDALGTLSDAVAEAKKAAGLKPDDKVELQILPRPKSIFEQLFGDPGDVTTDLRLAIPGLRNPLWQAALLRHLFAEPSLVLMPFQVKLR